MKPRRIVEEFRQGRWTEGQDGKTYLASVKVNGVEELFTIAQPISGSALATESRNLGRPATQEDWERLGKTKIMKAIAQGALESWPASMELRLDTIESMEVDDLFLQAKEKGFL